MLDPVAGKAVITLTRCREHRVRDGPTGHNGRRLTYTRRSRVCGNEVNLDRRHLIDPQHGVIVKVRLLNDAVLQRDFAVERGAKTERDAATRLFSHSLDPKQALVTKPGERKDRNVFVRCPLECCRCTQLSLHLTMLQH